MRALAIFALVIFVFAVSAPAKDMDANMTKDVTVKGKVEVKKDAAGTVTAVMINGMMKNYNVVMDAKGMELAKMEGQHVEATGTVMKKDKEHWLTVASYQEKMKDKEKETK